VLKPKGNGLLGTPRHRWDNNINLDLSQVGIMCMDRIALTQDRCRLWTVV